MKRETPKFALFVAFLALVGSGKALATEAKAVERTCPVCGTKTPAVEVQSAYADAGIDPDGYNRQRGAQVLLLVPTTCPSCLYTRFSKEFEKPVDEALKKKILEGKPFSVPKHRPYDASSPEIKMATRGLIPAGTRFPAWVRLDLLAQVEILKGSDEKSVQATKTLLPYCFRFEENPFTKPFLDLPREVVKKYFTGGIDAAMAVDKGGNLAWGMVRLALQLVEDVKTAPEADRRSMALYACFLLRAHGENPALLRAFEAVKKFFESKEAESLEKAMKTSIALERKYQEAALKIFEKQLEAEERPDHKIYQRFRIGEWWRRLGEKEKAEACFKEVLASEGANEVMRKLAQRQREFMKKYD
ncbi:MAG: DUF2225 domain-containing protein [Planctomycetota bacterium]|jgi:hypothetical protein